MASARQAAKKDAQRENGADTAAADAGGASGAGAAGGSAASGAAEAAGKRAGGAAGGGAGAKPRSMRQALASIDRQAPNLTYLGLGCWIAWNTIAFSGAFWLHDTDTSIRAENLMLVHLAACVVTLLALALASKRTSKVVAKNRFTFAGALIACAGSALIVVTREALLPSQALFMAGCVLSGVGTTMLFIRSAALFGALPPHRALYQLAVSVLFASMVYFVLAACPGDAAAAGFVLLPLASAVLFSLRSRNVRGETQVLAAETKISRRFVVLPLSIGLCSTAIELVRAYLLIGMPPSYGVSSTTTAQLIDIPILVAILAIILLAKDSRDNFAKLYSVTTGGLVVLIVVMAIFTPESTVVASAAWVICSCFNMVVWAMLFYLVFQWKGNAVRVVGLGNAALSAGTIVASLAAMAYQQAHISEAAMLAIIAVVGIAVLIDVLFVFSEKQIGALLLPVDEGALGGEEGAAQERRRPGKWVQSCEAIAQRHQLSARETEVLVALARGRTAQEIADRDVLSIYTVRAHIRSIYAKLDVHSKKELVDFIEREAQNAKEQ